MSHDFPAGRRIIQEMADGSLLAEQAGVGIVDIPRSFWRKGRSPTPGGVCEARRGRPSGRDVYSRPSCAAVSSTQPSAPNGQPRRTLRRMRSNSAPVCGSFIYRGHSSREPPGRETANQPAKKPANPYPLPAGRGNAQLLSRSIVTASPNQDITYPLPVLLQIGTPCRVIRCVMLGTYVKMPVSPVSHLPAKTATVQEQPNQSKVKKTSRHPQKNACKSPPTRPRRVIELITDRVP